MSAHQRLEAATDLSKLLPISDDIIVACLRERVMTDTIYTNIGASGLIALNPHKYISSNADSILQKYAAEYRNFSELFPHISFRLPIMPTITCEGQHRTSPLYLRQYPLTQRNVTLDSLHLLFRGRKIRKLSSGNQVAPRTWHQQSREKRFKISYSSVLNSLPQSSSWKCFNLNASRFGKYTELQFSDRDKLTGVLRAKPCCCYPFWRTKISHLLLPHRRCIA